MDKFYTTAAIFSKKFFDPTESCTPWGDAAEWGSSFWVVTSALLNRLSLPFPLQPLEIQMQIPQLTCSQGVWCQNLKVTNDQCSQSVYACKCCHAHIITYPLPGRCNNGGAFRDVRMIVSMSLHASCFGHQLHWSRQVVVVTYSWNKLAHCGWAAGELMKWPRSYKASTQNSKSTTQQCSIHDTKKLQQITTTAETARYQAWHHVASNQRHQHSAAKRLLQLTFQQRLQGFHQRLGMYRACGTMVDRGGGRCFVTPQHVVRPFLQFLPAWNRNTT